jgi:hypothetical protein
MAGSQRGRPGAPGGLVQAYGEAVALGWRSRGGDAGAPQPEVVSITGAPRSHSDDLNRRMSRYLTSMLIRTVCVVLVVVIDSPVRWVFAVGAIVLPYVAVVMANARGERYAPPPPAPPPPTRAAIGDLPSGDAYGRSGQ